MPRYTLRLPGVVTVSDAYLNDTYSPVPPQIVGDPNGVYNDNSDASYAELETFEHPDVSYADLSYGTLTTEPALPTNPDLIQSVVARVRYQALAVDMHPPHILVDQSDAGPSVQRALEGQPTTPATQTPAWEEIPLDILQPQMFLDAARTGVRALTLTVQAPWLFAYTYRSSRMRIFEAQIVVITHGSDAPPCRIFPREDGLGVGAGRNYPPNKSQQRSSRGVGYY